MLYAGPPGALTGRLTPTTPETTMDDTTTAITPTDLPSIEHPGLGESGPTRTIPACPIELVHPSSWNYRKIFNEAKLAELTADIAAAGITHDLVVRKHPTIPDAFEIVCGERRFRAAKRAGLAAVPVKVRELDDRQAREVSISENGNRDDVHPLEEADGFLDLHVNYNESVEEIAGRFGVSVKLVHQRLSLAKLCDEGRTAFLEGRLTWGVALRLARLPTLDYQREAVKYLEERAKSYGQPVAFHEAARWVDQRYHLRLADAPFDTKAADLLPGVGACGPCPRNSDAQIPMFGDEVTPGQCMDPVCFARKKERGWEVAAAALADGRKVLTAEQSVKIMPPYPGGPWMEGYVRPEEKPREFGGKKTWHQLLGALTPAAVIARDRDGKPVELLPPDELKAAVKKAGLGQTKVAAKARSSSSSSSSSGRGHKTWQDQQKERETVAAAQVREVADAFAKRTPPTDDRAWWQAITKAVLLNDVHGMKPLIAHLKLDLKKKRKGVPAGASEYMQMEAALAEEIDVRTPGGCRELLTVGILTAGVSVDSELTNSLEPLAKLYSFDPEAVAKKARAEIEAAKKKPAAVVAKPAGKGAGKATAPASKKPAAKKAPAKKGGRK